MPSVIQPEVSMPFSQTEKGNLKGKPEWLQDLLGLLLLFLMAFYVFFPLLFKNKALFLRDYHFITYPFRYFLSQAYHEGVMPYWTPHAYGGMPFFSAFHPGVFYPPSVVFFLPDTIMAINLFYFIHFLVLGFFLYLLGKHWGLSFVARLCSSATGMLSGFIVAAILTSNFFLGAVWLPMVFWMFLKYRAEKRIGYFIGTVLAIATQTLAACPEISIMTLVLLYAHCLWFMPKGEGIAGYGRMTVSLGLAVVLALGLTALQLWPTAELLKHSPRSGGINYQAHTIWSLEGSKLATLALTPGYINEEGSGASPDFLEGFLHTLYMGLLSLVFIFIGFLFRREKAVGFWLLVFLFGIWLALGKYNPFYEYVYHSVPLLNLFRFPAKFFYVSSFAAAFLTGFVLDALLNHTENRRLKIYPVVTVLILLFVLVAWIGWNQPNLGMENSLIFLFIFGFAYVLFYFGKIRKIVFTTLVLLLILVDLNLKDFKLLPLIDRKFYEEKPVLLDSLQDAYGKHRIYSGRIQQSPFSTRLPVSNMLDGILLWKQYITPYTGMVYGMENVAGKSGLGMGLINQLIWVAVMRQSDAEGRLRILKRSNVGYWINPNGKNRSDSDGNPVISPDRIRVFKDALPRAYLVSGVRLAKDSQLLTTYYAESFDPLKEVLLSERVEFTPSEHFEAKVKEVSYRPNHVTVKTSQEGNGFLVLVDSYFPGWTVTVDGKEEKILRANHYYRAVQLGPGVHTLEFDYFPEGFKEGLIVSAISLLILIALPLCKPIKRLQLPHSVPFPPDPEKAPEINPTVKK